MCSKYETNSDRLWESIEAINKIGATPAGGVCRLALSDEDRDARDLFRQWCVDAGCQVRIDAIGNIFARRPGRHPDRPIVMTGSHLDTQPAGGRFDGTYGVLAGLEVVRTLNDLKLDTDAPIEVVVWTNEASPEDPPQHAEASPTLDALLAPSGNAPPSR